MGALNQSRKLVSILDPAIDYTKGYREYVETRDASKLVFHAGRVPTTYYARHLPTRVFNLLVEAAPTDVGKWTLAFKYGIVEVHNKDGRPKYVPDEEHPQLGPCLSDEQLDDFPPVVVQELGQVIHQTAFLGRGSTVSFRLLPSLHSHLLAQIIQLAESRADQSAASTPNEPPSTSSDGEPPPAKPEQPGD